MSIAQCDWTVHQMNEPTTTHQPNTPTNTKRRGGPRKKIRIADCRTMSVPEAGAQYLGLGPPAAYASVRRGEIPVLKIGKLLRVPIIAMERMLNEARRNPLPRDEDAA